LYISLVSSLPLFYSPLILSLFFFILENNIFFLFLSPSLSLPPSLSHVPSLLFAVHVNEIFSLINYCICVRHLSPRLYTLMKKSLFTINLPWALSHSSLYISTLAYICFTHVFTLSQFGVRLCVYVCVSMYMCTSMYTCLWLVLYLVLIYYIFFYIYIVSYIYIYIYKYIYIYIYICFHFYLIFITYLLQLSLSLIRIYDTYIQTLLLALSRVARISVRVSQEATHWSSKRVQSVASPEMNIRITTTCTTLSIQTLWLSPSIESNNKILVKKGLNALSHCVHWHWVHHTLETICHFQMERKSVNIHIQLCGIH